MSLDRDVCDINTYDTDIDEYLSQVLGSQFGGKVGLYSPGCPVIH